MGPENLYGEYTTCDSRAPQCLRSTIPETFFPCPLCLGLGSESGQKVPEDQDSLGSIKASYLYFYRGALWPMEMTANILYLREGYHLHVKAQSAEDQV